MSARCEMARDHHGRVALTPAQLRAVDRFIFAHLLRPRGEPLNGHFMPGISPEQHSASYHQWVRGGHAWDAMQQGGTGIMAALLWYHHAYRPGSREWRPSIIIAALVREAERWMAEQERAA